MNRQSLRNAVALLAFVLLSSFGCVTQLDSKLAKIPPTVRVGVLVADPDSRGPDATLRASYIYAALAESGLSPVALNDVDVTRIVSASSVTLGSDHKPGLDVGTPALLSTLKPHFEELGLDYVLIVHVDTWALDRDMRAVVVRVKDMNIIGSRYYKRRTMGPLCVGLSAAWGASLLVCPWFAFVNTDEANYEMVHEFVGQMLR